MAVAVAFDGRSQAGDTESDNDYIDLLGSILLCLCHIYQKLCILKSPSSRNSGSKFLPRGLYIIFNNYCCSFSSLPFSNILILYAWDVPSSPLTFRIRHSDSSYRWRYSSYAHNVSKPHRFHKVQFYLYILRQVQDSLSGLSGKTHRTFQVAEWSLHYMYRGLCSRHRHVHDTPHVPLRSALTFSR